MNSIKTEHQSLTYKNIPLINRVSPEYSTEAGEIGAKLLELSVPFIRPRNRLSQDYLCVNLFGQVRHHSMTYLQNHALQVLLLSQGFSLR